MVKLGLLLSLLVAAALPAGAQPAGRPMQVEDILSLEGFGNGGEFVLGGKLFVYVKSGPYRSAPNRASALYESGVAGELRIVDVEHPEKGSRALLAREAGMGMWLAGASPDGSHLAIYSLKGTVLRAGIVDMATRAVRWFAFTPALTPTLIREPVWVSSSAAIFATLPPGELPGIVRTAGLAKRVAELADDGIAGKPSATELVSRAAGSGEAPLRDGMLVLADGRSGKATALAPGFFPNIRVSPDARFAIALAMGDGAQAERYDDPSAQVTPRRYELRLITLGSRHTASPCPDCRIAAGTVAWSGNSRQAWFVARDRRAPDEPPKLYRLDIATAAITPVALPGIAPVCDGGLQRLAEAGGALYIYATRAGATGDAACARGRGDWYRVADGQATPLTGRFAQVGADPIARTDAALFVLADNQLVQLDRSGANVPIDLSAYVTSENGEVLRARAESSAAAETGDQSLQPFALGGTYRRRHLEGYQQGDPGPAYGQAILHSGDKILLVDLLERTVRVVTVASAGARAIATTTAVAVSPVGTAAAYLTDRNGFQSGMMVARAGHTPVQVDEVNAFSAAIAPSPLRFLAYDLPGAAYKGGSCLKLPPGYVVGKRYPLVVDVYPDRGIAPSICFATRGRSMSGLAPFADDVFAGKGYIVMKAPAPRALSRTAEGPNKAATPLIMAAVDAAVAAGYVDPDRLFLLGFSQGMHEALRVLMDTKRFKAAVVLNGVSDFAIQYADTPVASRFAFTGEDQIGTPARFENQSAVQFMGAKPWENAAKYTANSALFGADKITTPLLIMHSQFDIFPESQATTLFGALYRLRRDVRLVTYWGEYHVLTSPGNIRDWWRRVTDWYASHDCSIDRAACATAARH